MTETSKRNEYSTERIVNGGELPDIFALPDGGRVRSRGEWHERSDAWRDLVLNMEYGGLPSAPEAIEVETLAHSAVRRWPGTPRLWTYRITCRGGEIPFDQHCLLALIVSRPMLLTYALDDRWSNPEGMVQCAWADGEVYRFLGSPDHLAFHLRPGAHSHATEDWEVLLDFIGWKWRGMQPVAPYNAQPYAHLRMAYAWKAPEDAR